MATNVKIPGLGDSVREAVLIKWHKADGQVVAKDDVLCELETDKANVDLPSPAAGVLRRVTAEGTTVQIDETVARIDEAGVATSAPVAAPTPTPNVATTATATTTAPAPVQATSAATDDLAPSVRVLIVENNLDPKKIKATGKDGRLTKEDVMAYLQNGAASAKSPEPAPTPVVDKPVRNEAVVTPPKAVEPSPVMTFDADGTRRTPLSKVRINIAKRLVEAQHTAAILTTFNEVDLTEVMAIRAKYKEAFEKTHKVGLGFMSFFARAIAMGLAEYPRVNAFIDGTDIVYHNYVHLGVAVSTDRGLMVPILRNVQAMSFAKIESEIKRMAAAARDNKLSIPELSGGTFTVTNGGVFGSLLSTPILTPPQSGILGMHTIQKRPVAINDKVEIRPMMYLALSYDHRLVDGKESVSFLVRVKQLLEDPARLMLEV